MPVASRASDSDSPAATSAVVATELNLPNRRQGKVRDVYDLPPRDGEPPRSLLVATDRVSAFDVVMPTPIPGKGKLLTEISTFWFQFIAKRGLCRTHLISTDAGQIPDVAFASGRGTPRKDLFGRVTIATRCSVIPIECVVRGYLEGSGWKDYLQTGTVCGVKLPAGLRQCDRLPEPIFTPATKAQQGAHDENIAFDRAGQLVGRGLMEHLREASLSIYRAASEHARSRGIIIADTKFEFGVPVHTPAGEPMLIDEALTPDSSRFWPVEGYKPGQPQRSFDKQYLREYLQGLVDSLQWAKSPPGPDLPQEVVARTREKYAEARDLLCT